MELAELARHKVCLDSKIRPIILADFLMFANIVHDFYILKMKFFQHEAWTATAKSLSGIYSRSVECGYLDPKRW